MKRVGEEENGILLLTILATGWENGETVRRARSSSISHLFIDRRPVKHRVAEGIIFFIFPVGVICDETSVERMLKTNEFL